MKYRDRTGKCIEVSTKQDRFLARMYAKKSGRGLALILSEGKNATDGFVSGFRITAGEHCLIGSVCYDAPRQTVNIFIDGEDTDELQN